MSRIVAIANAKGGVGKTTTAINLAAALTERGRKVLAVDLDPQASLTLSLGFLPDRLNRTVRDALDEHAVAMTSIVAPTQENFDVAPANRALDRTANALEKNPIRPGAVRAALEPLRDRYDYMLIDCPANAGDLTGAALAASDEVIIPLTTDDLTLESFKWFLSIIKNVQLEINPTLHIAGVFFTMYDPRTRHAREIIESVQTLCGPDIPVFATTVWEGTQFKDSSAAGESVLRHAPRCPGAQAYRALAKEIEEGIRQSVENELTLVLTRGQALERKDPPAAFAAFCRATDLNPKLASAWAGRGASATRWDEAIRSYTRAVRLEPENQETRDRLEARVRDGIAEATPQSVPEMVGLAHYLEESGEISLAGDLFRRVTGLDDTHEEGWVGRARTSSDPRAALAHVKRVLEINPRNDEALRLYCKLWEPEETPKTGAPFLAQPSEPAQAGEEAETELELGPVWAEGSTRVTEPVSPTLEPLAPATSAGDSAPPAASEPAALATQPASEPQPVSAESAPAAPATPMISEPAPARADTGDGLAPAVEERPRGGSVRPGLIFGTGKPPEPAALSGPRPTRSEPAATVSGPRPARAEGAFAAAAAVAAEAEAGPAPVESTPAPAEPQPTAQPAQAEPIASTAPAAPQAAKSLPTPTESVEPESKPAPTWKRVILPFAVIVAVLIAILVQLLPK